MSLVYNNGENINHPEKLRLKIAVNDDHDVIND